MKHTMSRSITPLGFATCHVKCRTCQQEGSAPTGSKLLAAAHLRNMGWTMNRHHEWTCPTCNTLTKTQPTVLIPPVKWADKEQSNPIADLKQFARELKEKK